MSKFPPYYVAIASLLLSVLFYIFGLKEVLFITLPAGIIYFIKGLISDGAFKYPERPIPVSGNVTKTFPKSEVKEKNTKKSENPIDLRSLYLIGYKDSKDNKTVRRITVKKIYGSDYYGDLYLDSFCHERQEPRTFVVSRIQELTDLETGEIIGDPTSYFQNKINNSPLGKVTKSINEFSDTILPMIYLGRSDGKLAKSEKLEIVDFLISKSNDLDRDLLLKEIGKLYCSTEDLLKSLKVLKHKSQSEKDEIVSLADRIVNADKKLDPLEIGIFEKIKLELKS
ncbi:hypothetical protein LPTSP2_37750 [Leptospira ellinghausenii]|uniref:WYL domain-containing protein n=1 Tax=Leptospira ellinghausenii TaxID=1917822 RepID=A0A2P2DIK5_9LEPT|nr:WYL domain-containing protein [Leptospira ellinghausenii]GBF44472.1 hypothetical protein LPTSP2_37750 [Leptospira ellinghausenii]